ncbi:MAG: MMPL family transporter [Pirellulales bacterium]|nr:MMPL family transporter [Pirellulales bacterium]
MFFDRLGQVVSRYWVAVLLGWAVLAIAVHGVAPRWDDVTRDGDFAYLPSQMTSVQGEKLLEAAFPDALSKSQIILVVARKDGPLQPVDFAVADLLAEQYTPAEGAGGPIVEVLSHRTEIIGEKLVSPEGPTGQALLIVLRLRNEFMAVGNMDLIGSIFGRLDEIRQSPNFPKGLEVGVSGSAAIGSDMLLAASESIENTERTTVILVILILLLVYRAPGLVIVPLLTILASVSVATDLVAMLTQLSGYVEWFDFKVFKTTRIFIVVILFGAGTDFCLFLIARYREELERGLAPPKAIAEALGRVGDALAASAMTTILGLGAMFFCDFGKFRNSGPSIALCLTVALIACLSLAPAMLRASGPIVFWPFGVRPGGARNRRTEEEGSEAADRAGVSVFNSFWEGLSRQVVGRPGLILVGSLLVLAPLAYAGLSVEVTYDLLSELQPDRPSVQGTKLLQQYFPAGETGPVTVLAYNQAGGFKPGEPRWEEMQQLPDKLYALEYVEQGGTRVKPITSVRSIFEPLGQRRQRSGLFDVIRKRVIQANPLAKATFLAQAPEYQGKVVRFDLVLDYDPFSMESIRFLNHLEDYLYRLSQDPQSEWYGTEFRYVGTTAGIRDLRLVTSSDLVLIQQLVPIAVLAVLIVLLRRPGVCLYLILSVLLGYFVTMGISEILFSWLYGTTYHGLDWKVPMFLFVILIAIGEDYNIYLATRVFEEQRERGTTEGLRVALVRTGGIITSCGVIMAGTFASMTTGTLRAMQELGFALSLGVLLDTFFIRTILVPAFLLLWQRNVLPWFTSHRAEGLPADPGQKPEPRGVRDRAREAAVR